ncbi:hypothetical protein ACQY0O_006790 [Thecaphora frezii]
MPSPPSPGDDATPFLLRCFARPAPFRPLADFDPRVRPMQDEYKLYVWKTTTLREVAQMLHEANPSLSQPLSLHAFRVIYFDARRSQSVAREAGAGVTRVALEDIEELMDGIELDTAAKRAFADLKEEVDERAAKTTMQQLRLVDGDVLECVTKPDPTIPSAPAAAKGGPGGFGPHRPRYF